MENEINFEFYVCGECFFSSNNGKRTKNFDLTILLFKMNYISMFFV